MAANWNAVKQGTSVDSISRVLGEGCIISGLDCICLHNLKVFSEWRLLRNEGRVDGSLDVFKFLSRYGLNFCTRFEESR